MSLKVTESNPLFVARSPIEWVDGDPKWSRVYVAFQWAVLLFWVLFTAVFVLNILWDVGRITSAQTGPLSWTVPWGLFPMCVWVPTVLVVICAVLVFPRKAVYKVAPTSRGLAIQVSPFRTRVVPWPAIRWTSPTRLEWKELGGTNRASITTEQSQRIYRWFHPQ